MVIDKEITKENTHIDKVRRTSLLYPSGVFTFTLCSFSKNSPILTWAQLMFYLYPQGTNKFSHV